MSIFNNLDLNKQNWHPIIRKSFLFIPSAGARVSGDDLILELFREVFFENRSEGQLQRLDPYDENSYSNYTDQEKYSLFMSRGRKKLTSNEPQKSFFTPLYPTLARYSWLRKESERAVRDNFLRILAQDLHGRRESSNEREGKIKNLLYNALAGENRDNDIAGLEINRLTGCIKKEESIQKLSELLGHYNPVKGIKMPVKSIFTLQKGNEDPLSRRIFLDLEQICILEDSLDRLQWVNLLKTFMRISSSVWLLSQMQVAIALRDKLLIILSEETEAIIDEAWVDEMVTNRHVQIITPTTDKSNEIDVKVQKYVKARIELNILTAIVQKYSDSGLDWTNKSLSLHSGGKSELGMVEFFSIAKRAKIKLELQNPNLNLRNELTRYCEVFKSWSHADRKNAGPAKGYLEYLLILRKMKKGDEDGGYLVLPGNQVNQGYQVFPGNLMLKLFTFLAAKSCKNRKLVFADIEEHFRAYGIDFGEKGGMRPKLISQLQEIGLLQGSPDAGSSVALINPYS